MIEHTQEGIVHYDDVLPNTPVFARLVEAAVTRLLTDDGRETAKALLRDAATTF